MSKDISIRCGQLHPAFVMDRTLSHIRAKSFLNDLNYLFSVKIIK